MQLEALNRQGKRATSTSSQVGMKLRSDKELSRKTGNSRNQIQRYVRLTELLPQLLDMVDIKKLPFNPAVELSYLKSADQDDLLLVMDDLNCVPTLEQSKKLKELSSREALTIDQIEAILTQVRENENLLKKYISLKNGVPSHDTIQRVMASIKLEFINSLMQGL
jgi:ParB family chromosome partitioning protein